MVSCTGDMLGQWHYRTWTRSRVIKHMRSKSQSSWWAVCLLICIYNVLWYLRLAGNVNDRLTSLTYDLIPSCPLSACLRFVKALSSASNIASYFRIRLEYGHETVVICFQPRNSMSRRYGPTVEVALLIFATYMSSCHNVESHSETLWRTSSSGLLLADILGIPEVKESCCGIRRTGMHIPR